MDTATVRSTPMTDAVRSKAEAVKKAHAELPRPPQAGRIIGIGAGRPS
jgi:hypothetical protein